MTSVLLLSGLAVLAGGAGASLLLGSGGKSARAVPYLAGLVGSALVAVTGVLTVVGRARTVHLGTVLGFADSLVRLDHLAGLFLTLSGGLGAAVSAALVSWSRTSGRSAGRATGASYLLLLGSVAVALVAGDVFTFLFAFEAITISFYLLTTTGRRSESRATAGWVTLGLGKVSGAALLVGLLLLAGRSHSFAFSSFAHVAPGAVEDVAFSLLVVGFGAKVGLAPFQVWLPVGYPAAPGPVRAAMAGLAVNVGYYGLWRFLGILGHPPAFLAISVLAIGGATALLGVAFAAVQPRLNRVLAYSSVENAGLILVGYGVALAGAATGQPRVIAVGLLAASLQVLAHAVAKSLAFSSSAFIESSGGTDDIDALRSVGYRQRASGGALGLAAVTLAGLPPTVGFLSEWFLLEALMQEFRVHLLALRLAMVFAGALVALTVGIAALCFIRIVGLTVLGRPPAGSPGAASGASGDGGALGRAGFALLGLSCLGLAAAAPEVVRYVARGLAPVVPAHTVAGALRSPWVLQPVFAGFSILSPSWLFVTMPLGAAGVVLLAVLLSRGGLLRWRRVPAWRSASAGVTGPAGYSASGYSNILRHVLSNVLGSRRSSAGPRSVASTASEANGAGIEVSSGVVEPVEAYLYLPLWRLWKRLSQAARRLQSGRLEAYVGYMLAGLVVLLALAAALR